MHKSHKDSTKKIRWATTSELPEFLDSAIDNEFFDALHVRVRSFMLEVSLHGHPQTVLISPLLEAVLLTAEGVSNGPPFNGTGQSC